MKRLLALACLGIALGCQPATTKTNAPATTPAAAPDEHAHAHEETGPHGGHMLHLEPTGAHAEWTHDDEKHLITVYLDDMDREKITAVKFVVDIPNAEPEEFALTAGDNGWTLTSETLVTHMNMGEAATVKLVIIDDSGEQSTKIEHHEHHHH